MNKYFNYFFSVRSALILMCIYACAIGFATFIENDYGTTAARALVFNSWWMELILVFLCSIFIYNIFQYKLYHLRKVPVLFLHLSFIFIIIGAGITRYVSVEGVMRIREGSLNNQFISSNQFLEFKIHDGKDQYLGQKELLPSSITNNNFTIPVKFKHHQIKIEYIDFIHDPVDKLVQNVLNGSNILELIIPSSAGGIQSEYILENTQKNINNLSVSFNLDLDSELHIFKEDSVFYFVSKYDVEFMKMSNQVKGVLVKNTTHKFNKKTLYTVLDKLILFG